MEDPRQLPAPPGASPEAPRPPGAPSPAHRLAETAAQWWERARVWYGIRPDSQRLLDEFQPDSIAIERRAPPLIQRSALYVLGLAMVAGILWSIWAELDRVVIAPGQLITTTPKMVVAPLETAVVRAINVKAGDIVRQGAVLATLDPTFAEADLSDVKGRADALRVREQRLSAQLQNREFKSDGSEPGNAELAVFQDQIRHRDARLRAFDEQAGHNAASIVTRENERRILADRMNAARQVEQMREQLINGPAGSKLQLLHARDNRLAVERDFQVATNSLKELAHEGLSIRAQRDAFLNEWRQKVSEEMNSVQTELRKLAEQEAKARRRHELVAMTAPDDAIVLELAQRSTGSVVREAETLMVLVPLNSPLEAELMVPAADIGHVEVGLPARIKLDAFPFQKHGTLGGVLKVVSGDAFAPGSDGKESGGGNRDTTAGRREYYKVRVEISPGKLRNLPGGYRLLPGMTVTGEIKVGTRSVISYLLYPLMRTLDEGMREP